MEYRFKEVYFDNFCALCKHKDNKESEPPCDDCLNEPVNENSHRPLYFEKKEESDVRGKA